MSAPFWACELAARLDERQAKSKRNSTVTVEVRASASVTIELGRGSLTPGAVCDAVCEAFLDAAGMQPEFVIDSAKVEE